VSVLICKYIICENFKINQHHSALYWLLHAVVLFLLPGISKLMIWHMALALRSHYVRQVEQHRDCGCNLSH